MNRVLSWPHTPILPGLLDALKRKRCKTSVTAKGMIHFDLSLGPVEMKFSQAQQQLPPGTDVYVWWKGGGFVCAPTADVDEEEGYSRRISERVAQARSQIAQARRERPGRSGGPIDIVLPGEAEPAWLNAGP